MQGTQGSESSGNGEIFGPYDTITRLESTQLGGVYLARERRAGHSVVLKTLRFPDARGTPARDELRRRFLRESEACASLTHDAIVRLVASGEANDVGWVAYEHFDAPALSDHILPYELLPVAQVLEVVAAIAEGLDHAHRQDVVHRDIKPANLLFRAGHGEVKIKDFGFAKVAETELSRTGLVLGTPSYKSPEQLAAGEITGASDLFSLGVTLYQLLSGRLPFEAESMVGLMQSIVQLPHEAVTRARADLPPALDVVVDRALGKAPGARYRSGEDMAAALRDCARTTAA